MRPNKNLIMAVYYTKGFTLILWINLVVEIIRQKIILCAVLSISKKENKIYGRENFSIKERVYLN